MKATNRQKKLLKFFHVDFSTNLSSGAAGWEISQIMAKFENRKLWNSYLYLTKDFDNQTDELMPVDTELIENTIVPDGWTSELSKSDFMFEVATEIVEQNGPYDLPEPEVVFTDHTFFCLLENLNLVREANAIKSHSNITAKWLNQSLQK